MMYIAAGLSLFPVHHIVRSTIDSNKRIDTEAYHENKEYRNSVSFDNFESQFK